MGYWYLLKNGVWWCRVPKNAQTSIKEHAAHPSPRAIDFTDNTIGVIRHPCDRLVSAWRNRPDHQSKDFGEFIQWTCKIGWDVDSHLRPQISFLDPMPSRLILFENVQQEFEAMGIKLRHLNKSEHEHFKTYFNPQLMRLVRGRYKEDFELYERCRTSQKMAQQV